LVTLHEISRFILMTLTQSVKEYIFSVSFIMQLSIKLV